LFFPSRSEQRLLPYARLARVPESTGWVLQLTSSINIDGKQVNSIEVSYWKTEKLALQAAELFD
jgi:hypothetical protein